MHAIPYIKLYIFDDEGEDDQELNGVYSQFSKIT